jgi:hypothetical protein
MAEGSGAAAIAIQVNDHAAVGFPVAFDARLATRAKAQPFPEVPAMGGNWRETDPFWALATPS